MKEMKMSGRKKKRISDQILIIINEIARAISSSLDVEDIFNTVANEISKIVAFDRASIVIIDENKKCLYPHVLFTEMKSKLLAGSILRLEGSAQEWILKKRQPIIEKNIANGSFRENVALYREGLRSSIRVPLRLRDKILGTINMDSKIVGCYSKNDLVLLEPVASQIAISLENARQHKELALINKTLEERVQKKAQKLKEMEREKLALTGMMAHNLKNPIVGIRKTMEMLIRLVKDGKFVAIEEVLEEVLQRCDLMTGMVNDIMDIFRYEYQGLALNRCLFDLSSVFKEIINLLKPQVLEKRLGIEMEFDEHIPPINGDKKKIHRVLVNLLDNAIYASPPEGKLEIATKMESGMLQGKPDSSPFSCLHLTISDQGPGIPPDKLSRIFDLFFQVGDNENACEKGMGNGVGLFYCKMVIEAHGGKIWSENLNNRGGVKVNLFLPLGEDINVS